MRKIVVTLGLALILLALASSSLAAQATGTVKGAVEYGTAGGGGSAANLEVTLTAYTGRTEGAKKTARTDAQGNFTFEGLEIAPNLVYQASILYQEVSYYSEPISLSADIAEKPVQMEIYESTADGSVLTSPAKHYLISPDPGGLMVSEISIVRNGSDRTYVGSKEFHPGARETLRFLLPEGAQDVQYVEGLLESRVFPIEGGFIDTFPVYPGDSQRVFRYRLPGAGDTATFTARLAMASDKVSVLLPDTGAQIAVSNLPTRSNPNMQGEKYVLLSGQNLAAGTSLDFKLEGLTKAAAAAAPVGGAPAAPAPAANPIVRFLPVIAGAVVLLVVLVLVIMRRRRATEQEATGVEALAREIEPAAPPTSDDPDDLAAERLRLIAAIARLDDSYEQGLIGAEEYSSRRAEQKRRLVEVVNRQKALVGAGSEG